MTINTDITAALKAAVPSQAEPPLGPNVHIIVDFSPTVYGCAGQYPMNADTVFHVALGKLLRAVGIVGSVTFVGDCKDRVVECGMKLAVAVAREKSNKKQVAARAQGREVAAATTVPPETEEKKKTDDEFGDLWDADVEPKQQQRKKRRVSAVKMDPSQEDKYVEEVGKSVIDAIKEGDKFMVNDALSIPRARSLLFSILEHMLESRLRSTEPKGTRLGWSDGKGRRLERSMDDKCFDQLIAIDCERTPDFGEADNEIAWWADRICSQSPDPSGQTFVIHTVDADLIFTCARIVAKWGCKVFVRHRQSPFKPKVTETYYPVHELMSTAPGALGLASWDELVVLACISGTDYIKKNEVTHGVSTKTFLERIKGKKGTTAEGLSALTSVVKNESQDLESARKLYNGLDRIRVPQDMGSVVKQVRKNYRLWMNPE